MYPVSKFEVTDNKVMAGRIFTPKPKKTPFDGPRGKNPHVDETTSKGTNPDLLHDAWQDYRERKGMKDNRNTPPSRVATLSSAPVASVKDEDARSRIAQCEEQLKSLTGKVSNIETEVTGLKTSFQDTLKTSLESNSRSLMSQFKDLGNPDPRTEIGLVVVFAHDPPKPKIRMRSKIKKKREIHIRLMLDVSRICFQRMEFPLNFDRNTSRLTVSWP